MVVAGKGSGMTLSDLLQRYRPLLSALAKQKGNVRLPRDPRKAEKAMNLALGGRLER